jgi:DNA ligase N terminus
MCQTISVVPARSDQHVPRLDLLGGLWNAACHDQAKEGAVQYLTVAEAYRDLEQASGRLALVDRLAALLAETPDGLLPVVCYLGQGLIAPEFAGVDLGLAEKLAVRAVAAATGASPGEVTALVRQTGDLGLAAEQLLAMTAASRPATLTVPAVVDTLHQIAAAQGPGSQGRKLDLLAGLLARATRWRPATCCAWSPRGSGWASARPPSWTRWPRSIPAAGPPGRFSNAPTTSAATWAGSQPPWPPAA